MHVCLNGYFELLPATGSGQYLHHLTKSLLELDDGVRLTIVTPGASPVIPSEAKNSSVPNASLGAGSQRLTRVSATTPFTGRSRQLDKLWFEMRAFPAAARRSDADLAHYPYFAAPYRCPVPVVVTIHDVIPLLFPQYRGGTLAQTYTSLVSHTAKKATLILADSQCSKNDISRLLGIAPDRIRVVYLAAGPAYRRIEDETRVQHVLSAHGLRESRYIFYLGGFDYRKNVPSLLRAFATILSEGNGRDDMVLALAGNVPSRRPVFPDVKGLAESLGIASKVRYLGALSSDDAAALYASSALFVYPSLYEGFGLPPLEAMSCGAPVICSNSSSLPEVVGDAAITFDPNNEDQIAAAMRTVLDDEAIRRELRAKGLRRAAQFTWRHTARQTAEAYRWALDDRREVAGRSAD